MRRGDIVTVSASGDYGKPRAAVIVQSDRLTGTDSVLVCHFTSTLIDAPLFRLAVAPNQGNDLKAPSHVMIDKVIALPRMKCGAVIGRLDHGDLIALNQMLSVMMGIAD